MDRNPLLQVRLAVNVGRDDDYSTSERQILAQLAELAEAGSEEIGGSWNVGFAKARKSKGHGHAPSLPPVLGR